MTLFQKVFQKHLDEQEALTQSDAAPSSPEFTPAESAPGGHLEEDDPPTAAETPTPDTSTELGAEPDADLVARAVQAHQLIEKSRIVSAADDGPSNGSTADNRNKTRLLGFSTGLASVNDPLAVPHSGRVSPFPCGWLVISKGPGRGESFALYAGVAQIGRGEGQAICLDFGDRAISRENHAAVAFDTETGKFFVGHGGKSNIIRLNGQPVLSTEELHHGATLKIGETELRFAALCDASFNWEIEEP